MTDDDQNYYDKLFEAYMSSSAQFNKDLLFFSSGALGISFAFIKDIVKLDTATYKILLLISWILFGIVVLLCVISHYTSLKALNNKMKNLNVSGDKESKKLDNRTKYLNKTIIWLLGFGLLFLIGFTALNI